MSNGVRAYTLATSTVPDGDGLPSTFPLAWLTVSFTGTRHDDASFWSAGSPTRLTIPTTGYYFAGGVLNVGVASTVQLAGSLRVNGSTYIATKLLRQSVTGTKTVVTLDTDWYFTAGDYVELLASIGSGSSLTGSLDGTAAYSAEAWLAQADVSATFGARVTATVAQSWGPSTAPAAIVFSTVTYDDLSFWSAGSPTRLTIPTSGLYRVHGQASADAPTSTTMGQFHLLVNGSTIIDASQPTPPFVTSAGPYVPGASVEQVGAAWYFTAGDYVELIVGPNGANSLTTDVGTWAPSLTITQL